MTRLLSIIILVLALTACTGDLSDKIDSINASQIAMQEEIKTLKESQDTLSEQMSEMSSQLESLLEKSSTASNKTSYELSDVEGIGFKPKTNTTLLEKFAGGFFKGFLGVNPNDGLIESWEGSLTPTKLSTHLAGEPMRVVVYVYDKRVEGSSAWLESIGSLLGTPMLAFRNLMIECDSQKVCEFIVESLNSAVKR